MNEALRSVDVGMEAPRCDKSTAAIYLFEDDDALAHEIVGAFADEGYAVTALESHEDVENAARQCGDSIFIMDRMVRNSDSLQMIERLRSTGFCSPVIVISSLVSIGDRIHGLRSGGDDYLIKPFSLGELIARVECLMRRFTRSDPALRLTAGDLVMDLVARTVSRDSREITLLPREFSLLEYFMRRPNQVVTRAMMLRDVWKYRAPVITNVVDVQISNLRRKIDGDHGTMIKTKRGIGFVFVGPADAA